MTGTSTGRRRPLARIGLLLAAILGLMLGLQQPAQAFSGAFYPTQSTGNRGSDVVALQYLLNAHGQNLSTDGVFGSGTKAGVTSFQGSAGLGADGIVGPATWGKLVTTVRQGDSGPAVRAVQYLLNAKRGAGLTVDGVFGGGTDSAVRTFQSHAGLSADGIAGPDTWRNLLWHYQYANFNAGTLCDEDPDGNTSANWGTGAAIGQLEAAATTFSSYGRGRIPVGDISFEHGGPINGHASHQDGLDADIWPIRTDSAQCSAGRITWQSAAYDRSATRQLIQTVKAAAPGHVKIIFFNDPVLINEGLTQPLDNHDNHLHVRYCELVHPNSLYVC
ncbi:penicillin-insensitive murein endopeptidase [Streptomyces sp. H10-C2]|uniref:penicillin-insensitive murein endopeptidase n=1 Tax=unclassified Streptomyces TaxID=2593676 RepID=UPI0024B942B3|nr:MULTISPECIES: penicillin-insensitive murein endopeptidase [unclassified Streptomyces]MDJ0343810.1 penicillin-insensitive murein endopeptidase [Streptomyces sp. PH10-H1]MDJ0373399.1 penicillin-insensitive murein endopeptidase [Streptomyces sp. H10-C2]